MKFSGILICSDVDGTLARHGNISDEHCNAVEYFQKNGGLFTLATGRHPMYARELFGFVEPNTYLIADNGMLIYDIKNGRAVHECFFDGSVEEYIASVFDHFPNHDSVKVHVSSGYYDISPEADEWLDEFKKIQEPIYKVVFKQQKKITTEMMNYFSSDTRFETTQSCESLFEIYQTNCGKGTAVKKIKQMLSDQIHTVICIGDYHNDITMLQQADIAVAVAGGDERLLPYADWIAPKYDDHPVAWLIDEIERKIL